MEQLVVGQKRLEAAVRVLGKIVALELHGHMIRCRAPPCYPFFPAPGLVVCQEAATPSPERVSPGTERAHPAPPTPDRDSLWLYFTYRPSPGCRGSHSVWHWCEPRGDVTGDTPYFYITTTQTTPTPRERHCWNINIFAHTRVHTGPPSPPEHSRHFLWMCHYVHISALRLCAQLFVVGA